jgi:hypothetical protein
MRLLLAVLMLLPLRGWADTLDEALRLVLASHPVLVAEQAEVAETAHQRAWSSDVTLSYYERGTEYGGPSGGNAALRLRIPLFDRSHELAAAKARTSLEKARETVRAAFLAEVERIGAQGAKVRELDTMRQFYRDRLEYRRKQVDEGIEDAGSLWPEAEKLQQVEFDYRAEKGKLEMMRESVAREYGGRQWTKLRDLLAELARS